MMRERFGSSDVLPGERECMAIIAGSILTGSTLLINYVEISSLCLTRLIDVISEVCRSLTISQFSYSTTR